MMMKLRLQLMIKFFIDSLSDHFLYKSLVYKQDNLKVKCNTFKCLVLSD